MTSLASDTEPRELADARLRAYDAASELRSVNDDPEAFARRLAKVARELRGIVEDVLLYVHGKDLETDDTVEAESGELDRLLESGWVPEAVPVEDVVSRIRERFRKASA